MFPFAPAVRCDQSDTFTEPVAVSPVLIAITVQGTRMLGP